jgi:hypothetical protein
MVTVLLTNSGWVCLWLEACQAFHMFGSANGASTEFSPTALLSQELLTTAGCFEPCAACILMLQAALV